MSKYKQQYPKTKTSGFPNIWEVIRARENNNNRIAYNPFYPMVLSQKLQ